MAPDVTPASIVISPATGTVMSGTTMSLSATVANAGGEALRGQTVEWRSSDANIATVSAAGLVTGGHTGETRIIASVGSITSPAVTIAVTPGAASQLTVRTQPLGAGSGLPLTTQPVIEVRDAAGNLVTTATATVTATIATGGGTLTGSSATAAGGIATFTTLAVSGTIGDRTLSFSVAGVVSATSSRFTLGPGAAAKLVIRTEPTGAVSGALLRTQPVVEIHDDADNLVSTSTAAVTASIGAGGGSATGNTAAAVGGVASFTALSVTGIAGARTLTFSAPGLPNVVSATFMLTAGQAAALRVRTQPGGALSGQALLTQPVVEVTDGGGNAMPSSDIVVTATITSGGGSLTLATATTVDGVATFSGLTFSGAVGQRTLTFSADGLTSTTSAPFVLGVGAPARLLLATQPLTGVLGWPLVPQPVVVVADAAGNLVSASGGTVTATIASGSGIIANYTATVFNGRATFLSMSIVGPPGAVTLLFGSANFQSARSQPITLSPAPATTTRR